MNSSNKEKLYKIVYWSFDQKSMIIEAKNAGEALENFYRKCISYNVISIEEYKMKD